MSSSQQQDKQGIGFIGLGIMGEGMASRLVSQGIAGRSDKPLIIWNRTPQKCIALKEKFSDKEILIQSTPKEVMEKCGTVFSILSTPEASRQVFEGENGVLAGVSKDTSLVDCATLAESDMNRMAKAVRSKRG